MSNSSDNNTRVPGRPMSVLVVGTGILGMTTAWRLSKTLPTGSRITVIEQSNEPAPQHSASHLNGSLLCFGLYERGSPWITRSSMLGVIKSAACSLYQGAADVWASWRSNSNNSNAKDIYAELPEQLREQYAIPSRRPAASPTAPSLFSLATHLDTWRWGMHAFAAVTRSSSEQASRVALSQLGTYSRECLRETLAELQLAKPPLGQLGGTQGGGGVLVLLRSLEDKEEQLRSLVKNKAPQASSNMPLLLPSAFQVADVEPSLRDSLQMHSFAGGLLFPEDGNGDCRSLVNAMYESMLQPRQQADEQVSVRFLFNTTIARVRRTPDGRFVERVSLVTAQPQQQEQDAVEDLNVDAVVICAGCNTPQVAAACGANCPSFARFKGHVVNIPWGAEWPEDERPRFAIADNLNHLYIGPTAEGLRMSAFTDLTLDPQDLSVDPARIAYMCAVLCNLFPKHATQIMQATNSKSAAAAGVTLHTCHRPVAPDDLPLIGRSENVENVFLNSGHGSKGWSLSFGSAALVADLVAGRPRQQLRLCADYYAPSRFASPLKRMLFGFEHRE